MTVNKGTREIRVLLDALAQKKTDKDRLFVLCKIKVLIECMEERLKKRSDKNIAAYVAKTRIIKNALKRFLTGLDKISAKYEEVGDSDVRDQMYAAVYRSFIRPQDGYALPAKFGMFSDKGNDLVRAALHKFLTHPEVLSAASALKSAKDRFAAFQDDDVQTSDGTTCFEYFGYSNKVRVA